MFCTSCGKENDSGLKFCTNCGASLPVNDTVASLNTPTDPSAMYSQQAQSRMSADQFQSGVVAQKKTYKSIMIACIFAICIVAIALVVFWVVKPFDANKAGNSPVANSAAVDQGSKSNTSSTGSSNSQGQSSSNAASSAVFLGINTANSSSNLATGGVNTGTYYASNVLDGNPATCWSEGVSGSGIGESITLSGSGEQLFSGFSIRNGYQKSNDLYHKNNRPKAIEVYVDGSLVDAINLADSGLTTQTFDFPKPAVGKEITFKIKDIYSGTAYSDCCISEIDVF